MIVIFTKGMLEEILELINVPDRGYHLRSFVASLSNNHHFLAYQENGITYVNAKDVYETGRETGLIIVSTNQEHRTPLMHFEEYMSTFDPKKAAHSNSPTDASAKHHYRPEFPGSVH